MDFYEVLEKRRTCRDFSDREVSDEILKKVIDAAFKAPTNDHLRQLEFIVVRGRESITKVIAPLAKNMAAFRKLVFEVDESGDKDKMAMFADALPNSKNADGERTADYSVFPSENTPLAQAGRAKLAQLLRFGLVCAGEHAARRRQRRSGSGVSYPRKRRGGQDKGNRECSRGV